MPPSGGHFSLGESPHQLLTEHDTSMASMLGNHVAGDCPSMLTLLPFPGPRRGGGLRGASQESVPDLYQNAASLRLVVSEWTSGTDPVVGEWEWVVH